MMEKDLLGEFRFTLTEKRLLLKERATNCTNPYCLSQIFTPMDLRDLRLVPATSLRHLMVEVLTFKNL